MKNKIIIKLLPKILISAVIVIIAITMPFIIREFTKHTHEYGEWECYRKSTCSTQGYEARYCPCGDAQKRMLDRLPHTEGEWTIDKEANEKKLYCTVCNRLIDTEKLNDHVHSFGDWVVGLVATCTEGGLMIRTCRCGWTEEKAISTTEHTFGDWVTTKKPSCTEYGIDIRECVCGKTEERKTHMLNHNYSSSVVTKNATCTSVGTREKTCTLCDKTISEDIPMIAHSYEDWAIINTSTCKVQGTKRRECTCGYFEEELLPLSPNHSYGDWITTTEPTENTYGEEKRTCSICDTSETRSIDKLEYDPNVWTITNGTLIKVNGSLQGSITIPSVVSVIGQKAFYNQAVEQITLSDSVTKIEMYAFSYCINLSKIIIPTSVDKIGSNAFRFCGKNQPLKIIYKGTLEQWNNISNDGWDKDIGQYVVICTNGTIEK